MIPSYRLSEGVIFPRFYFVKLLTTLSPVPWTPKSRNRSARMSHLIMILIILFCRGTFLLSLADQLVTGVTTSEVDLAALLGCSASEWAGARTEARRAGRVTWGRYKRQVSINI